MVDRRAARPVLRVASRFPRTPLDALTEPWRSFLVKVRDDLESWASVIELPRTFRHTDIVSAARELALVLRYLLRSEQKRADYLMDLERRCEIPLTGSTGELRAAANEPRRYVWSEEEVRRIVGQPPLAPARTVAGTHIQQVILFYDQTDQVGAVTARVENDVQPGQQIIFYLGISGLINRYNVGFIDDQNQMVARIPEPNDDFWQGATTMTPALARQLMSRFSSDPCLDAWFITAGNVTQPP